jgi:kinesin family protein 1
LLVKPSTRGKDGLKVRESTKTGVYIEGAVFMPVSSYAEIEGVMQLGTDNRTIGSTNMNATSSRAHTVTKI